MGGGALSSGRPALPVDGVTFRVTGCSAPGHEETGHEVTITQDWRLLTPHDLDAERVGVALGGDCPCVELADRTLPAVRGYLTHRLRLEPAAIVHADDGSWRPSVDVGGCCRDQGFPQAVDAAAHLRRPRHWAQRFGATPRAVTELAQRLLGAVARAQHDPALADQTRDPGRPALADQEVPLLVESYGLSVLWDAGLHPSAVAALCRHLSRSGEKIRTRDVLESAYGPRTADSPSRERRSARPAGSQRPRTRDLRRPDERHDWVEAGVPLATVTLLMSADAYSLDDARLLAARLGRSPAEAAEVLGRWQLAGMTPPVDTLVGLYWGPMLLDAPPPKPLVDRTLQLARDAGLATTRVDAALALVRAGSPSAAAERLADPSRRPDDPYSQ